MAFLIQDENLASEILSCYALCMFLMLLWLYLFLLRNCHPPISLTFCTVLHSSTCESAKGESRMITQFAIHCRSRAHKGSTMHLPTTPPSNAANESDTDFKYTTGNPWRWISQNEILWFTSVKLKDCFLPTPRKWLKRGSRGEELQNNNLFRKIIYLKGK